MHIYNIFTEMGLLFYNLWFPHNITLWTSFFVSYVISNSYIVFYCMGDLNLFNGTLIVEE